MSIKLNFINRSNDANNSQVVIFQKNVASNFDELAVAWHVIENCGISDNHPFSFPMSMEVSASDSWGNYMPKIRAENGVMYHVERDLSGDRLNSVGASSSSKEVQVRNDLNKGAVNAGIYKGGKLLALKTNIAPGQKAVFEFKPSIWIGVVSQVVQGDVMNSAILTDVNTELSLLGIASADIIMTGGGPGKNSTAFQFKLENIQLV